MTLLKVGLNLYLKCLNAEIFYGFCLYVLTVYNNFLKKEKKKLIPVYTLLTKLLLFAQKYYRCTGSSKSCVNITAASGIKVWHCIRF